MRYFENWPLKIPAKIYIPFQKYPHKLTYPKIIAGIIPTPQNSSKIRNFYPKWRLILHTPGPEIPDLAYHIHSLLRLLIQLLNLLRHMILQWFQPKWHMVLQRLYSKWLSMALCIHGKIILLILLRLLTCHHINVSKMSNLSRGQNSCMNMPISLAYVVGIS